MNGGAEARAPAVGVREALTRLPPHCRFLVVGVAVNRLASFIELFMVLWLTDRGESPAAAGLALTAFGAGAVLGLLCGGVLTERLGGRWCIAVSMFAAGIGTAVLPLAPGVSAVIALSGLLGAVTQLFRPAATALLAATTPAVDLVLVMAGYRFGLNVGAMLTPLVGAALAVWSWTALFVVDAGASLLFAALALRVLPRDRPSRHGHGSLLEHQPGLPPDSRPVRPLRDRRFLLVVTALFLIAIVEVQYVVTLPLQVREYGLPAAVYAALVALNGLLVISLEPALTARLRHWPLRRSMSAGIALIGLGIASYGLPGGIALLVLATLSWTVGEMLGAPPAGAYPALVAPAGGQARYIALAVGAQGAGYAVGPVLGVAAWTHSPAICWIGCAVVGVTAAALARRGAADVYERPCSENT